MKSNKAIQGKGVVGMNGILLSAEEIQLINVKAKTLGLTSKELVEKQIANKATKIVRESISSYYKHKNSSYDHEYYERESTVKIDSKQWVVKEDVNMWWYIDKKGYSNVEEPNDILISDIIVLISIKATLSPNDNTCGVIAVYRYYNIKMDTDKCYTVPPDMLVELLIHGTGVGKERYEQATLVNDRGVVVNYTEMPQ